MNFSFFSSLPSLISWDFLILLITIFIFGILGLLWHRKKILSLILSFYLAAAGVNFFPHLQFLDSFHFHNFTAHLLYFWGLALIFLFILITSKISFSTASSGTTSSRRRKRANTLKGLIYGLIGGGMFISFSLELAPLSLQQGLSPLTFYIFLSAVAKIIWALAPILSMMIVK